jgi:hypothetical protein
MAKQIDRGQAVLVGGAFPGGGQPPGVQDRRVLSQGEIEDPEDDIGIPDIHGKQKAHDTLR